MQPLPSVQEILDVLNKADQGEIKIFINYEEQAEIMRRNGGCLPPYGPGPMWGILPVTLGNGWNVNVRWKRGFPHYIDSIDIPGKQLIKSEDFNGEYTGLLFWSPENRDRWINTGPIIDITPQPDTLRISQE